MEGGREGRRQSRVRNLQGREKGRAASRETQEALVYTNMCSFYAFNKEINST